MSRRGLLPTSLSLPLTVQAPAHARAFLREALGRSGEAAGADGPDLTALLDRAELLVSELVTNAVRYGGPPITLVIDGDAGAGLHVRLSDGSTARPVQRSAAPSDESGRGLQLVDLLSSDWGVDLSPDGKTVWFHLES